MMDKKGVPESRVRLLRVEELSKRKSKMLSAGCMMGWGAMICRQEKQPTSECRC